MDQTTTTPNEEVTETSSPVENTAQMLKQHWVLAAALATGLGTLWVSRKIKRQSMLSALASAVATTTSVLAFANKARHIQMPHMDSSPAK
ncbi:MAG TPA: hypothetical protein VK171_01920 [Fimbriimonas sp.]|nr:hypothetical protein [Fimbriimonas sp.]